ncbi:putative reverse transcriptase domain-containing protein [Tanacetum coccineum]
MYASRQLKIHEKNYTMHGLELGAVVFTLKIWKHVLVTRMRKLERLYIDEVVARHGVHVSIISDHRGRFTSRFWLTLQKALGRRLNMRTTYHPQTDGQSERTIHTLKDMLRACVIDSWWSPVLWAKIVEIRSIGPKLVQETTNKVILIKEKLKAARDCQKGNVGNWRKHLELKLVIK